MALPSVSRPASIAAVGAVVLLLGALAGPVSAQQPRWADTTSLDDRRAQVLFVRGLTQSYLEDYGEAVRHYERALELAPQQPALLAALAEAESARENPTSALYYARQARKQAPNQPHYHRTLADLLKANERPQEAASAYRTLLSQFPDQHTAYRPLAQVLQELDRPHDALRAYQALVDSTNRPPPQVYATMLELHDRTGTTEGLEEVLQALISQSRDTWPYRRRLGRLYVDQDRLSEAIPIYEGLHRDRPSNLQLLSRLQMLYERTGQPDKTAGLWDQFDPKTASPDQLVSRAQSLYDQAQRDGTPVDSGAGTPARRMLHRALDQDSSHVPALDLLGTLQSERGSYADAARTLQRAVDVDPRAPDRWDRLAAAHLNAGQPQRAANTAEEGLLLFPGRPSLLHTLASARLRQGAYDDALAHFQEALSKVSGTAATADLRARLRAGRGRALDRLGRPDRAAADFEAALELNPDEPSALRYYALHLAHLNQNVSRALQLAERAVQARPGDPAALGTLGWVHFKRGDPAKAQRYLQEAADTGRAPTVVYERLGDVYRALGNDHRARKYWQKTLERNPERDSLRQKLRALPR